MSSAEPLVRTSLAISGVNAFAVVASERSFCSRSEDSSCGAT